MNAVNDTRPFIERGYVVNGKTVYGTENGVPFSVTLTRGQAAARFALDRRMDSAERTAVKDELKRAGYKAALAGDGMSLLIKADSARPGASIIEALEGATAAGLQNGVPFSTECAFCGNRDADAFMLCPPKNGRSAGYRAVHQRCVASAQGEAEEKALRNEGSYLLGLLGALCGAVVGALPTVLTIWLLDTIYAIICALIPLCVFYGYKLFKGKMNAFSIAVTIVFSVVGAFAIQSALDILDSMLHYGATLQESVLYLATYLPVDAEYQAYFFSGFGQVLLFVGIGVFACSGIFRNTNKGAVKTFAGMRATLRTKAGAEPLFQEQDPFYSEGAEAPKA